MWSVLELEAHQLPHLHGAVPRIRPPPGDLDGSLDGGYVDEEVPGEVLLGLQKGTVGLGERAALGRDRHGLGGVTESATAKISRAQV